MIGGKVRGIPVSGYARVKGVHYGTGVNLTRPRHIVRATPDAGVGPQSPMGLAVERAIVELERIVARLAP